jgi:hypothetical protein
MSPILHTAFGGVAGGNCHTVRQFRPAEWRCNRLANPQATPKFVAYYGTSSTENS